MVLGGRVERGLVQAECPTCGRIQISAADVVCGISEADEAALCEFPCSGCGRVLLRPLPSVEIPTLLLFGARKAVRPLPFELVEPHRGPALSWDELLDLHFELEQECCPQDRLARGEAA